MEIRYHLFNSNQELANFLEETKYRNPHAENLKATKDAMDKLRYGDSISVEALKASCKTNGMTEITEKYFTGSTPLVAKALQGDPKAFLRKKKIVAENKFITIIYDQTVPWHYTPQRMQEEGKKLLAVLQYMEQTGFKVRLYACCTSAQGHNNPCYTMLVKLKDYSQKFSINKLAFDVTNPNFLRGVFFEWVFKDPVVDFVYAGIGHAIMFEESSKVCSMAFSNFLGKSCLYITHEMVSSKDFSERLMENSENLIQYGYESL